MQTAGVDLERRACIERVIDSLIRERYRLRRNGADEALLEASGYALGYWYHELSGSDQLRSVARQSG
jgi:hypothetical protein